MGLDQGATLRQVDWGRVTRLTGSDHDCLDQGATLRLVDWGRVARLTGSDHDCLDQGTTLRQVDQVQMNAVRTVRHLTTTVQTVYKCLHDLAPKYTSPSCAFRLRMLPDAVNYVLLADDFRIFLATTCILFRRFLRLELTSSAYPAINFNCCLQALTKDISARADIAPSALETIIFYCLWAI